MKYLFIILLIILAFFIFRTVSSFSSSETGYVYIPENIPPKSKRSIQRINTLG